VTKRNQRLGDLAAGTLVPRERQDVAGAGREPTGTPSDAAARWDVTAVTPEELAAVRQFLDRRAALDAGPRARLARQLAEGLGRKVSGPSESVSPERFLEELAAAKARRG
jgi:hypothetical protein